MNISWYGHRCVRLEAKEGSVLIDPFDPKEVGLRGPTIKDDIVLLSEAAPSKAALEKASEGGFVIRGPGEYERKGIAVAGILAYQDSQEGKELGLATLYRIQAEEMSICNLGAIGQETLSDVQLQAIGTPDILIIPVGGQGALDPKAAAALVNKIEPKVVIPVQFSLPNASYTAEKVDKFVKELGLPAETVESFRVSRKQLPTDKTQLIIIKA